MYVMPALDKKLKIYKTTFGKYVVPQDIDNIDFIKMFMHIHVFEHICKQLEMN